LLTVSIKTARWVTIAARAALVIVIVAITFLATTPAPPVSFSLWDKLNHFIAFATLALLADYSFPKTGWRKPVFLYLFIYGVSLEIMQWFTKYRFLDYADVIANGVGLISYIAIRPVLAYMTILNQL
jgi:VanZ family protein